MRRKPTIVVVLFDQKSNGPMSPEHAKWVEASKIPKTASGFIRYCTRLDLLPSPEKPMLDLPYYITKDGKVGAVLFENFSTNDLPGMAREFEHDAKMAPTLKNAWVHGCISIDVSPADFAGKPEDLLAVGADLMKMLGVDKNRYMLAVHLDSENIHVHFLYSRTDGQGRLRERDRKMAKFMAEEATALLAHRFGFELAPHHLSRVTQKGIVDLASERIVRDHNFVEQIAGMKSRNTARKKTKRNELLTLALVARHEASDVQQFRALLASHGIEYKKLRSGAEFINSRGEHINASEVDKRFTPTNLFNGALLHSFPDTPEELLHIAECARANARLDQDLHNYATVAHDNQADATVAHDKLVDATVASPNSPAQSNMALKSSTGANERREIERFFEDRPAVDESITDAQKRWDAAAVATMKSRPGRPAKEPILPGWPASAKFVGCLGSHADRPNRVNFNEPYKMLEREWQTEVWREGQLIASIQYSRMTIVSNKEDDLREALRAAHDAWGTVEIFGTRKFKKQMAQLAAEMNIPISNRELKAGIAQQREAMKRSATIPLVNTASEQFTPNMPEPNEAAKAGSSLDNKLATHSTAKQRPPVSPTGRTNPLVQTASAQVTTATTESSSPKTSIDEDAGNIKPASSHHFAHYFPSIKNNDWAVRYDPNNPAQMTLYPNDIVAFRIPSDFLRQPVVQAQLLVNYERQQAELAALSAAVREESIYVVTKEDARGQKRIRLEIPSRSPLVDIYERRALHPEFEAIIELAHDDAMVARRAVSQSAAALPAQTTSNDGTATSTKASGMSSNVRMSEANEVEKGTGFGQNPGIANTGGFIPPAAEKDDVTTGSTSQKPEALLTVSAASGADINNTTVQPPTPIDELSSKEQQHDVQTGTPAEPSTEVGVGSQPETPPNELPMDVLMEKHGRTDEQAEGTITESTDMDPSHAQNAANRRREFEEEILHVLKTERIRLKRVDGKLVFPIHDSIPTNWHQYATNMQGKLEESQSTLEDELKSFANQISTKGYDPTCEDQKRLFTAFEGQPEVTKALAERQRYVANVLAQQSALAAQRGF